MKNLDLSAFPKVDKTTWETLAQKQLKGENPNDALSWLSMNDFSLLPYYDISDIQELESQIVFFQSLPNHEWKLYEKIQVAASREANEKALKALMGGCDGVIFSLGQTSDFSELLDNINSKICNLSFINAHQNLSEVIKIEVTDQNCLFQSEKASNPIEQLVEVLSKLDPDHSFIYREASPDFFHEIATIRALRFLLNKHLNKTEIKIHSHIPAHDEDDHQWFLNTTAGLASVLGGSHSISFTTKMEDERISRNVGNLIREESGISKYEDQCGGSYYIEVLTNKLIEEALKRSNL